MNENIASLLVDVSERRPQLRVGVAGDAVELGDAVRTASSVAATLRGSGLEPGARIAVVEETSTDYLLFWMGCQLAGIEPALINPFYPADLVERMMAGLQPSAVATSTGKSFSGTLETIGFRGIRAGSIEIAGTVRSLAAATGEPAGVHRDRLDGAGLMHTSGTTGLPKFCLQSHEYFLRLGRSFAQQMQLDTDDTVFAPLQMFHINPLGYGVVGALCAGAGILASRRFKPDDFWETVRRHGVTALVLHAPPVKALMREPSSPDDRRHEVKAVFGAGPDFLGRFGIELGLGAYGSTEAGGISCYHVWHPSDPVPDELHGQASRMAGRSRLDIDIRISAESEILVRERVPGTLFSGYLQNGALDRCLVGDGWFATGDRGHMLGDALVFDERIAESVRIRGEYIPLEFVEVELMRVLPSVDVALWKQVGEGGDDELVLYVAGATWDLSVLERAIAGLPGLMRPKVIKQVSAIPRDAGVGKVQRRRLETL